MRIFALLFSFLLLIAVTLTFSQGIRPRLYAATTNTAPINKNVYLLIIDPQLRTVAGNPKLHTYKNWQDPMTLVPSIISFFQRASNGRIKYTIKTTKEINSLEVLNPDGSVQSSIWKDWLKKTDGYYYTEADYLTAVSGGAHHDPDSFDYYQVLNNAQLDICSKVNSTDPTQHIDELWIYGAPWFGFFESALATSPTGQPGFFFNGSVFNQTSCNRLLPVMGFNYERGWQEAVHDFGHRAEATLSYLYDGWSENSTRNNWEKFALDKGESPNYSNFGCGSIHYPPNTQSNSDAYRYDMTTLVPSYCDDFYNYPNLGDPAIVSKTLNCQAWGCTDGGYYEWWWKHLPSYTGTAPDGKLNDWELYAIDPNVAQPPIKAGTFSNLSANLTGNQAQFNFTYSGSSIKYSVEMSTIPDMSLDVYLEFGLGSSSPIIVTNPQSKWDKYACGKTLYWRVYDSSRSVSSPIQTSTINCAPADTIAPTVKITYPYNNSSLNRKTRVPILVTASDNVKVVKVEFYIDGNYVNTDSLSPYSYTWVTPQAKSTHILMAKAYDSAGNVGTSAQVKVNIK